VEEPSLEVAEELHSKMHVIVCGYEGWLVGGAKSVDQLVDDVWEPGKCLKVISLAIDEIVEHLGVFIRTTCEDNVHPFGQADLLDVRDYNSLKLREGKYTMCSVPQDSSKIKIPRQSY
jgi:hypothetical protein